MACQKNVQSQKKYIYYLHGRIIEMQGKDAVSEDYGSYEFDNIFKALSDKEHIVIAEIRTKNVDYLEYAKKVSKEIDSLVKLGVVPKDITVVGASKGAIIASTISNINPNPINYVFLAGNNKYQEENNDWKFHGQVLCIYDKSDSIAGGNYDYWKNKENYTTKFEQIELNTNLGHGFLYKPLDIWIEPTRKWIENQNL
jgi:dienelactone hydrolase